MEQITRRNGVYYYGECRCVDVDDAYGRFRAEYHASVGRDAFRRLDRLGQRTERIHGFGFRFPDTVPSASSLVEGRRVPYIILGLVGICYCRSVGVWDLQNLSDEQFEQWFDWAFSYGSGGLRQIGKKAGTGRNSKRLKTRYK